ncbi:hypothetical protein PR048_005963 [Dryococelus australis]|uniref:Uncharacterized protein n=1 Tax=Dryococelus australis TaxID=614101 RepID=A0ABQ9I9M6_9NEOP|nr:hypothetical protein PR048_005963 [Dryococelus australis]
MPFRKECRIDLGIAQTNVTGVTDLATTLRAVAASILLIVSTDAKAGETRDLRENPPTSGIVRHDSHYSPAASVSPDRLPSSGKVKENGGSCSTRVDFQEAALSPLVCITPTQRLAILLMSIRKRVCGTCCHSSHTASSSWAKGLGAEREPTLQRLDVGGTDGVAVLDAAHVGADTCLAPGIHTRPVADSLHVVPARTDMIHAVHGQMSTFQQQAWRWQDRMHSLEDAVAALVSDIVHRVFEEAVAVGVEAGEAQTVAGLLPRVRVVADAVDHGRREGVARALRLPAQLVVEGGVARHCRTLSRGHVDQGAVQAPGGGGPQVRAHLRPEGECRDGATAAEKRATRYHAPLHNHDDKLLLIELCADAGSADSTIAEGASLDVSLDGLLPAQPCVNEDFPVMKLYTPPIINNLSTKNIVIASDSVDTGQTLHRHPPYIRNKIRLRVQYFPQPPASRQQLGTTLAAKSCPPLHTHIDACQSLMNEEIWVTRNSEFLRANEGDWSEYGVAPVERAGETEDPRENSLTYGIVQHDSHLQKSVTRPAIDPSSPWVGGGGGESANRSSTVVP